MLQQKLPWYYSTQLEISTMSGGALCAPCGTRRLEAEVTTQKRKCEKRTKIESEAKFHKAKHQDLI